MSDPHALPDRPKTPRAPSLQPDRPAGGAPADEAPTVDTDKKTVQRQKEQTDTALDNVRDGYG